jgi:hypothetical protein
MAKIKLLCLLLCLLSACSSGFYEITGNVDTIIKTNRSADLSEIFEENGLQPEYALLIASDGTALLVSERSFPHLEIKRDKGVYSTSSEILPPVSNIRDLSEISIYSSAYPLQDNHTPFSRRIRDFEFLGESSRNGHFIRKYRLKD